ncbi:MAG TPA: adenosine deaminase [Firmicutes bacterium]|nr:adenosine deaminase [Bacillota bacterium]
MEFNIVYPDILKLKKAELHLHLDGSLRPESMLEIAAEENIPIPGKNVLALKKQCVYEEGVKSSLTKFLKYFQFTLQFLQSESSLSRGVYELLEDLNKENVTVAEIRFAPHLHLMKGLTLKKVMDSVISGLEKGLNDFPMKAGFILCMLRGLKVKHAHEVVEIAEEYYGKGVIGVDLAGDESKYPLEVYRNPLIIASQKGINVTVHAGESGPVEEIRKAVFEINAKRIGHGIAVIKDPPLIQILKEKKIALEICPTSNVQTNVVKSYPFHPVNHIFQKEGIVTINSDNRLISNTSISKELSKMLHYFHWTIDDVKKVIDNAFKSSFIENAGR